MKKFIPKILILLLIGGFFWAIQHYGLTDYLTLGHLKANKVLLQNYYAKHNVLVPALYLILYILIAALSLPGATILTLAGGTLFGLGTGFLLVSFASTLGATAAFLISRFLLRNWVEKKFHRQLATINKGIKEEGAFYLFSLRLIPAFPFFLINLTMGLTRIRIVTFFFISQIGMLPGTFAYVNAGVQLSRIDSLGDILSPSLILSFAILGLIPLIAKKVIAFLRGQAVYRKFRKPKSFDYNMVVIGGGSAGLVTAYICATVKARVALVEKHRMGGDCLNTGCVPSKALLKAASLIHKARQVKKYGIKKMDVDFDFSQVMEQVQQTIQKIEPHDSPERYTKLGVDCIKGKAVLRSPWEIEIDGRILRTRHITIATGASPIVPSIPGLEQTDFLTSDTLWNLRTLPSRLLIIGGGPIGVEMAQAFQRLGSQVTLVQRGSRILPKEDPDVSAELTYHLEKEGVYLLTEHNPQRFEKGTLIAEHKGKEVRIDFDKVLSAVGRRANVTGFGLEDLGVRLRANGTIEANSFLQTNFPNIWACGDVTGPFQLTHGAAHQAWYCAVNALFGTFKKFKVDYSVVPWATYTDPEVATVGMNEESCKKAGISYEVTKYPLNDLDRAIADGEDYGFVKVLTKPGKDKIIGATIVGTRGSDLLLEFTSAMKHNFGLNSILGTIHPYPTMGEANKYVAGRWREKHKPAKLLKWVRRYHLWKISNFRRFLK